MLRRSLVLWMFVSHSHRLQVDSEEKLSMQQIQWVVYKSGMAEHDYGVQD